MRRNELKRYRIRIDTITPVHIGTGEVYLPTNFIIDDGVLYEFDEMLFVKSLPPIERKSFDQKLDDYMKIIDFYKSHRDRAKKIAYTSIGVTRKIGERYAAVRNKDNSKNKNLFEIQRTYKNPNTHRVVIPGSSIKGVLDTVLGIFPARVKDNGPRQELIVSDAMLIKGGSEIGFAYRLHKDPQKESRSKIPQMVEIVREGSSFLMTISTTKSFDEILESVRGYYQKRAAGRFSSGRDFFAARIGKFSGKPYMVYDTANMMNSYGKPVATHTLYERGNQPFGWVKFTVISEDQYQKSLEEIAANDERYHNELENRLSEIRALIAKEKELRRSQKEERERRLREAEEKEEQEQKAAQAEAERIASLPPLERKIAELIEANPNKAETVDVVIFNAVKSGELDEFGCEAVKLLKDEMIKLKKWVENTKNPQKDKKYKRTIEVIGLLEECE